MTLVRRASAVSHPALCSVTASGQNRRPAATRSSASIASPFGLRFPLEILFAKCSEKIFSGASVNAELRPWEPGPSLASLKCDPSKMREFQQKSE